MQRLIFACGLILTSVTALFAQKGAVTGSSIPSDLKPRGLFAAQTDPKSITLSWYSQALPRNAIGAQIIICNIGGRETRPSERSWGKVGPGPERPEPLLQTYVLQVTSEVPHQCRLELRTRMDATSKNDQVERFAFNEVTPKLSAGPVPPSPTQVEATVVAPNRVRVTWTGSGEVTAVLIQRRMAPAGLITVCYMCPPIGVFVDSVSSARKPSSVQYAVTSIGRAGRSRPAMSRELNLDGRGPVAARDTTTAPLPAGVVVTSIAAGSLPASGQVARNTLQENEKTVTQIVRLGPAAQIPVHHHPHYNETVIIHSGDVELTIGGQRHFLRAGQVAYIPAGTMMSVMNTSRVNEAQVVAVFSNVGTAGPLMVAGPGPN